MTNCDAGIPIQQDLVNIYTMDYDSEIDNDYDDDFIDALMTLDDQVDDVSISDTLFERIVSDFVFLYGLATTEPKRQALLAEIYSQIEMASCSAGRRPPRYVFPATTCDGLPCFQVASQAAITEEIKSSTKSHFKVIPKPGDIPVETFLVMSDSGPLLIISVNTTLAPALLTGNNVSFK